MTTLIGSTNIDVVKIRRSAHSSGPPIGKAAGSARSPPVPKAHGRQANASGATTTSTTKSTDAAKVAVDQATASASAAASGTTSAPLWDPEDNWEKHKVSQTRLDRVVGGTLDKIAPIRTHERVMGEVTGSLFGLEVGITFSQLELVKKGTRGVEVIQVVNQDGSSNVETVLGRHHLSSGHRIELQGPAINTSVTPGDLPLGARFVGVGVTTDVTSAMDHDALSYTAEVKLTTRSILELATLGGAGAAAIASKALEAVSTTAVAEVAAGAILGAVPVLSAVVSVNSARRAIHVCRDKTASPAMKAFAVMHALGDAVRIAFPLAGTVANAALVAVAAGLGWVHHRHAPHAPPIGPPRPTVDTKDL